MDGEFFVDIRAISKNPDQLAEVSAEVSVEVSASFAEVSASFAEVSAVHSQKLPRFTRGNLHEISNTFLWNLTVWWNPTSANPTKWVTTIFFLSITCIYVHLSTNFFHNFSIFSQFSWTIFSAYIIKLLYSLYWRFWLVQSWHISCEQCKTAKNHSAGKHDRGPLFFTFRLIRSRSTGSI